MVMMKPLPDQFVATIPATYLEQGNLINYYITAMDSRGKKASLGSFDHPFQVDLRNAGDFTLPSFIFRPDRRRRG